MEAIRDNIGWIRCGSCSHKLMKVLNWEVSGDTSVSLEIKCSSCKEINEINIINALQRGRKYKYNFGYGNRL